MVTHLVDTPRSWLLFYDSDSVLPALIHGSLAAGQPQDWAMSSVLFIPELAVYLGLAALGLSVKATFILNAIVNLIAVYLSFRFVAGCVMPCRPRWSRIAGALLATAAVTAFVLLDSTANRNSLELVSLLATTTYYSATVVAMILTVGIVGRILSPRQPRRISWVPVVVLFLIAALSAMTDPLYLVWSAVPVAIVVAAACLLRVASLVNGALVIGSVGVGIVGGLLLRIPLAPWITVSGASYAQPDLFARSFQYYATLLRMRLETVPGALSIVLVLAIIAVNVAIFVRMLKHRNTAGVLVAGFGWMTPVIVTVGAILLGTNAARYLEPDFFAPLAGLCVVPAILGHKHPRALAAGRVSSGRWLVHREIADREPADREIAGREPASRKMLSPLLVLASVVVLAASVLTAMVVAIPRLSAAANSIDPDVRCVDQWVTASGEIGVGEYWTIRAPKAYLADPARLVQVNGDLDAYAWLVNRADFGATRASFAVVSAADPPLEIPAARRATVTQVTHCGRYTIVDYGHSALPIGP